MQKQNGPRQMSLLLLSMKVCMLLCEMAMFSLLITIVDRPNIFDSLSGALLSSCIFSPVAKH